MKRLLNTIKLLMPTLALLAAGFVPGHVMAVGTCDANNQLCAGAQASNPGLSSNLFDSGGLFQKIGNTLIFIVGAASVIMLIIGGLRYVLSSGNASAVEGAKNTILFAIIGIIVASLSFAIVNFVIVKATG